MELFRLVGSIIIDDKDALKSLKTTDDRAKASAKSMDNLSKGAAAFGKAFVIGATAAVGAMTTLVVKFTEATSEISDNSKKVGMSAEEYQKWTYAAKQSGMEQSDLLGIMKKAQTSFTDATQGVKKNADAYKKLGIDVKKMTAASAFKAVIKILAETTDETERNAIANDIFGKSYADLAPLLAEGADGIEKLLQEASDLGGVMSNETVAAGDQFGDTLDKIKTLLGGVAMKIAEAALPYLQQFADWILNNKQNIIDFAEKTIKAVSDGFVWFIDNKDTVINAIGLIAGAFALANGPLGVLVGSFALLALHWGDMDDGAKIVGALGAVTLAATAAAIAVGALQSAWSLGIAAAAIVAGVLAITYAINNANKNAKIKAQNPRGAVGGGGGGSWGGDKTTWHADGGIFTKPTILGNHGVGEAGAEAIMPLSKLPQMVGELIDYDKLAQAMSKVVIVLDKEQVGTFVDKRILKAV